MSSQAERRRARHREPRYCVPCGWKFPRGTLRCERCGLLLTRRTKAWTNRMPGAERGRFRKEAIGEAPPAFADEHYARIEERQRARREAERERAEQPLDGDEFFVWMQEQPGTPLGAGYPSGSPLRMDGESHSNAWRRILRGDPCAYCGRRESGTVDHVVPRSTGVHGVERWPNLVGACTACNVSKGADPLLLFLLKGRGLRYVRF